MKKSTLLAVCATVILFFGSFGNGLGQSTYTLVTSTADLVAGAKYLIVSVSTGTGYALGYQASNNRPQATTSVTVSSGSITATPATTIDNTTNPYEITLGGSTDAWTLYDAVYAGYLYAASSSNNYLRTGATVANWTISFSSNAAVMTCTTGGYSRNILRYNSSSSLFSCYSSGQAAVYLYKLVVTAPTLSVSPNTLSGFTYIVGLGPSTSQSYNLSGSNLSPASGDITITPATDYEVSLNNTSFSQTAITKAYTGSTLASTPVYVRLKSGLPVANYNGENIVNSGGGATSVNVTCSGYVVNPTPSITITGTLIDFGSQLINTTSAEQTYTVSGANLTADIIITPPAGFEISKTTGTGFVGSSSSLTLNQSGGSVASTAIYVRFAPTVGQSYSGNITHTSTGAATQNVAVSGTGYDPNAPLVVISQVYGGGGNSGSVYKNDFIELYNRGNTSVSLNGWSVQYSSASGTTWQVTNLTNVTLLPGQYYLIKEAGGTGGTTDLPTPDATGTIGMGNDNIKVALVNSQTALSGSCPTGSNIIDFVGTGSANCYEGSAAAPVMSNTNADIRANGGCTDANNNSTDFSTINPPTPRNTSFFRIVCSEPTTQASNITFSSVATTSMTVSWTNGNGTSRAVFMKEGSGTISNPVNGTTYTASADWSSKGTQLGTSGYYCIYNGTGTSVSLANLSPGTTYYVQAFEYFGSAATSNYYTSTATNNPNNQTTLFPTPTITSFTPTSGCSSGETSVTITGTNFTGATAVTFNSSNAASFTVDDATQITAVTPSGVTTGKISVTTPGGTVQSAGDFTVNQTVEPSVSITVSANPVTSGTSVAITATPVNGGTTPMYQLYIDDVASGPPTSNSSISIAPPAGTYSIHVVMTPDPTLPCFSPATATSNTIILVVTASPATSTWTGAGNDHNWHNAANWDNGVPGSTTAVTIPSGLGTNYPTVSSSAICASITIESGASLINNGLLGIPAEQATVNREISDASNDKWHLFISPITQNIAATATSCFNGAYLDRYDEPTGEWVRLITGENVVSGYGYSINYLAGSRNLVFEGTLKNSPLTYSNLSYSSGAPGYGAGWHLIGNPYPCGINPSLCAAPSNMNAYAYIWNTGSGNYNTLQFGSSTTIIAPLQGFFVKTTSDANSLTLANNAKTHGGTFYKNDNVEPEALMVKISGNNYSDQTKVRFNSDATAGFDQSYDAYKLWGLDEAPQLYSILSDEVAAVNTLPSIGNNPLVPLGLKVGAESSYTLTFEGMESFDSQIPLRLDDLKLGISKDIRTDPVYSFTAAPGDAENRFRLRFASAIGFENHEASNILINAERNVIRVNYMGSSSGIIHLYNDAGQLLSTQALSRGETTMSAEATGIYLVKVITGKSVVTKKVVVVR